MTQANSDTNTLSTALPTDAATTTAPARSINELQRLYWAIRRELWENRSIYIAPLAVAALILLAFLYGAFKTPVDAIQIHGSFDNLHNALDTEKFDQIYEIAAALIMATTFLVSIFYCLDALYSERRDRSILFWKSLPISDTTTVLSKAAIPLLVLPAITFIVTVVTQSLMLLINLVAFHIRGIGPNPHSLPLFQMAMMLLYHLIASHILWYAPIYAWLLLVSAYARRTPLLWATLPPLALGVLEVIAFHTTHIFALLRYRFSGGPDDTGFTANNMAMDPLTHISPLHFLTTPGLWTGLALAALFLAGAIQLRHYRNPI